MGIDNSILLISAIVIFALHGYFFFKPIKLVTLPGKTYRAYFSTSCVLLALTTEGVVLFAALCLEFLTAWVTLNRIPVLRSVEQHTNTTIDGKSFRIDRVVHRYFWPHYMTTSKNSFRRGRLMLVPWVDVVEGFIYHYNGTTYNKLSHFAAAYPRHAGTAEQTLAKSLG